MFMLHENGPGHGHEHGTGMDMDIGMDRNVVIPLLAKDSFLKILMSNRTLVKSLICYMIY
jgi:hypothetical protein